MPDYEPPIRFRQYVPTRDGDGPIPYSRGEWIPYPAARPEGRSPQATRIYRRGEQPVTLRLHSSQAYKIGRNETCQMLFPDEGISRLHGLLYFVPELSHWAYRDPFSTRGSFLYLGDQRSLREEIDHNKPYGVVAGQVLELGDEWNRLEFLDAVPPEVAGVAGRWRSKAARKLEEAVEDAARKSGPVLLFGPSGSGKTYLAQRIHELSGRKGPYVEVNCGRLPREANQLQSELLGHMKGAYTGASFRRVGALFEADKGTLFLDEVESLPPEAQAFLLDVLEGKSTLRPLGADKGLSRPNVRFICSTKTPLDHTPLRQDLVNRLVRGHRIIIPTLGERREDMPILISDILAVLKAEVGTDATVTEQAMEFLMAQPWPGHVRQLKDELTTAIEGHHGHRVELRTEMFEEHLSSEDVVRGRNGALPTLGEQLAILPGVPTVPIEVLRKRPIDLTRDDLLEALRAAGGIMKRAAELLGCSPTTLRGKRKDLGV